jgi:NTE family protein
MARPALVAIKYTIQDALKSAVRGIRRFAYAHPLPSLAADQRRPRLGLALGGGFARGLAHLGVLKVLVENQIPIDALAGTSVGSVVAAAFASGSTIEEMIEEARATRWKDVARWTIARLGFASNAPLEALLGRVLHGSRFEELSIPLAIVATDVSTGQAVTFREGDLVPALRASCSFPGLFVPVKYRGRLLVDGALVGSVPVAALRDMGVQKIIAVYLKAGDPRQTPSNVFQVVGQAFQIVASLGQEAWRKACDVVIEPDTTGLGWDDFERADELILAGERAARQALPALRALLNTQSAWALARPVPAR